VDTKNNIFFNFIDLYPAQKILAIWHGSR